MADPTSIGATEANPEPAQDVIPDVAIDSAAPPAETGPSTGEDLAPAAPAAETPATMPEPDIVSEKTNVDEGDADEGEGEEKAKDKKKEKKKGDEEEETDYRLEFILNYLTKTLKMKMEKWTKMIILEDCKVSLS